MVDGDESIAIHRSMDVWSIGVMAFELMSGESFFPLGATPKDMQQMLIGAAELPHEARTSVWLKVGRLQSLIRQMVSRTPGHRPSMTDVSKEFSYLVSVTGAKQAVGTVQRELTGDTSKLIDGTGESNSVSVHMEAQLSTG